MLWSNELSAVHIDWTRTCWWCLALELGIGITLSVNWTSQENKWKQIAKLLKFKSAFLVTRCCHLASFLLDSFRVDHQAFHWWESGVSSSSFVLTAVACLKCDRMTLLHYPIVELHFLSDCLDKGLAIKSLREKKKNKTKHSNLSKDVPS